MFLPNSSKTILVISLGFFLAFGFQNCSPVNFSSPTLSSSSKATSICNSIGLRAKTPMVLKTSELGAFDIVSLPRPAQGNWNFGDDVSDKNHLKIQATGLSVTHSYSAPGDYIGWVKEESGCEFDFTVHVDQNECIPTPPILPSNPIQITSPQNVTVNDIHNAVNFIAVMDAAVKIDLTKGVRFAIYSGSTKLTEIPAAPLLDPNGKVIPNQYKASYVFSAPGTYIIMAIVDDQRPCIGQLHSQITFTISCPTTTTVQNLTYDIFDTNNKLVSNIQAGPNLLKVKDPAPFVTDSFLWKFGDKTPNAGPGAYSQVTHTFAIPALTSNGYWIEVSANDKTCNSNFVKTDLVCQNGFDKYNGNLCVAPCVLSGQVHSGADGACACPSGQELYNNQCVNSCTIAGQTHSPPNGTCTCPTGQEVYGNKCVNSCTVSGQTHTAPNGDCACPSNLPDIVNNTCTASCPIPGQTHSGTGGICACPTGQEVYNNQCVNVCTVIGQSHTPPSGTCACPADKTDIVNNTCTAPCTNGYTRNASGTCICQSGVLDSQKQCCPQANVVNGQCVSSVTTQDVKVTPEANNQVVSLYMIIDSSYSMSQYQTQLASGMQNMLSNLVGKGYNLDLKLYTTTIGDSDGRGGNGGGIVNGGATGFPGIVTTPTNLSKPTTVASSYPYPSTNVKYFDYDQNIWVNGAMDAATAESKGWSKFKTSIDLQLLNLQPPYNQNYNLSVRSNTDSTTFNQFIQNAIDAITKIGTDGSDHEDAICTIAHIMAQTSNLGSKSAFIILSDENRDNQDSYYKTYRDRCLNVLQNTVQEKSKVTAPVQYRYNVSVNYTQPAHNNLPGSFSFNEAISQWSTTYPYCTPNSADTQQAACVHTSPVCTQWRDGICVNYVNQCDQWAACPNGYQDQGAGQCVKFQYVCNNTQAVFADSALCSSACQTLCKCGNNVVDCSTQASCAAVQVPRQYTVDFVYPNYYNGYYNYQQDTAVTCPSSNIACTPKMLQGIQSAFSNISNLTCNYSCNITPPTTVTQPASWYSADNALQCPTGNKACNANSNNTQICQQAGVTNGIDIQSCSVTPTGGSTNWQITSTSSKTLAAVDILAAGGVSAATQPGQVIVDKLNSLYPKDANGNPGYFVSTIVHRSASDLNNPNCQQNTNSSVGQEYLTFANAAAKSTINPICSNDYSTSLDPLASWMQDIISNSISITLNANEVVLWVKINGVLIDPSKYVVDVNAKTISFQSGLLHKNDTVTIARGLKI